MARSQYEFRMHCWIRDALARLARADVVYWHTPNGEKRSISTGKRLKRMGVLPGVADWIFILPPEGRSCFLELKAPKGTANENQRLFKARITQTGAPYAIATSGEQALSILSEWGVLKQAYRRPSAIVGNLLHGEGQLV